MYFITESLRCFAILVIPYVFIEWGLCSAYKRRGVAITRGFIFGWLAFAGLFTVMVNITGAASIDEIMRFKTSMINADEINLIPFSEGLDNVFGIIMNMILFVPIGAAMPMLWKSNESMKRTVMTGFAFSFVIEISQLFNFRTTDIDDLIMNTIGTAAGFMIYKFMLRKMTVFKIDARGSGAALSLIMLFLVYFFIRLIWPLSC